MMNQPLRRVDPLGRSAPTCRHLANQPWLSPRVRGSVWPISTGSVEAIVDNDPIETSAPAPIH